MLQISREENQECAEKLYFPEWFDSNIKISAEEMHKLPARRPIDPENITLALDSVNLLCEACQSFGVSPIFRSHAASLTAAEKQRIVAPAMVQKTVTLRIGGMTVLCTAIGDPILRRADAREIGGHLGLSRSAMKSLHINPVDFDPLSQLGLPQGMVSPFLPPGRRTLLKAVVLIDSIEDGPETDGLVAVSLSLNWSLLIDAKRFGLILRQYAKHAYPWMPLIDLRCRH
ncbi:MAG TPA: hypothetical protein VGV37_08675 [Aliidongia sp.]|uniref:hypothetical protein n=1 Tax=Aliidongia sp. TaxID=1914230 RepID=UPI002DDDA630|nr:hypothetical protein [Aliidongia sp.]HEV2674602.1 hypothetical protein [Aliidongia sp.]